MRGYYRTGTACGKREEHEDGTAVVSRHRTDLPTHGLCSWRREGSLHQQQFSIRVKSISAIKITEDAAGDIGRGAHFSRASLGGTAYATVAHFCQVPSSSRARLGRRGLVRWTREATAVDINHQFQTIGHLQLGKNGGEVVPYRRLTDAQALGDLLIP